MSNDKTSMKPSVTDVNQSSAKLIEAAVTINDVMKQSTESVNNPQGMENTNSTGLLAYLIM